MKISRYWSDAIARYSTNYGRLGILGNKQKLQRGKKGSLEPSEGAWFYQYIDFSLLGSRF